VDLNGGAAYKRAGYKATGNSADVCARRLLRNVHVSAEIARLQAKVHAKIELTAERALAEAWNIVVADPNELIEYRRVCCDTCYGGNTTLAEQNRDPNPDCPECKGLGYGKVHAHDTRKLSPQARALYAGVKITKEGFEVKMHSKLDAMEKVFKHLGLFKTDNEQKQPQALPEALAAFLGNLHQAGGGKLAVVPRAPRARLNPDPA